MSDLIHNLVWLPHQIKKRKYDVLLKPMESSGFKYGIPTITICHDVQELINQAARVRQMPLRYLIDLAKRRFKSLNLQNSAVVVCNSLFTRDAASAWYRFDFAKSVIGYCGVAERFFELSSALKSSGNMRFQNKDRYFLTFATGDARENYHLLPEILLNLRRGGCNAKLILAGARSGEGYISDMNKGFFERNLRVGEDYQYVEFLGEDRLDELIELYVSADFYLELSGHEGFGMQLAEAMACGTTCISSGAGALAEIGAGFDVRLSSLDPAFVAETIVKSYAQNLHCRDNGDQVDYVRTHYTWNRVADVVAREIVSVCTRLIEFA
jgi:glycosyltransferase involved in cell wall biosynthesis